MSEPSKKKKNFNLQFEALESGLRERVKATIDAAQSITFDEIDDFHEKEAELYDQFPELDNFEKSDDEHILQLEEVRKVVISNRSLFSEIGKDLETLKNYLRLLPTLREVSEYDRNLIRAYPELNLSAAAKLSGYCDSIVSLKMPLLGYLFAGKKLLSYGEIIAKITGFLDVKPHKKLEEYVKISRLPTRLTKLIFGFGGTNDDLKSVFEFSKLTGFVSSSQAEVLNNC